MSDDATAVEGAPAAMFAPRSVAIAGAWGYIGRKFLDAALALGSSAYVARGSVSGSTTTLPITEG